MKGGHHAINYAKIFTAAARRSRSRFRVRTRCPNSGGGYSCKWMTGRVSTASSSSALKAARITSPNADLVKQNHDAIVRCVKADELRCDRILKSADSGRAPEERSPVAVRWWQLTATPKQALAFQNLGNVCRIGTHLFHFAGM